MHQIYFYKSATVCINLTINYSIKYKFRRIFLNALCISNDVLHVTDQ